MVILDRSVLQPLFSSLTKKMVRIFNSTSSMGGWEVIINVSKQAKISIIEEEVFLKKYLELQRLSK